MKTSYPSRQLVNGPTLLESLFDEKSRPSIRWLRDQTRKKQIPFVRLGHLVFFDLEAVRSTIGKQS